MGTVITIIVIVVVVAAAIMAAYAYKRRRSDQLQQRFGPEYERTIEESGDRKAAERDLRQREQRRAKLDIHPLTGATAERYRAEWNVLQQGFVDAPADSVEQADRLVLRMMRESGYPVDDFDQRAADISVDHPEVAENYREAHRVAVAQTQGPVDTEDLRQAVTAYRRLVDVLLVDERAELDGQRADLDGADIDGRHVTGPTDTREQS
ncbi:hypothetical protein [Kribbella sp. VKM Ac-2568]|uniref:hypothetical protein n=1 Tax=Kribbella sp. VKM Ac-2568 TaxID=2512219 RepID=UPI0010D7465F|nr:hypothetical protein [Kribbella sp. VKM Ac-2568]TCM39601.1 hypothetical protein EV648_114123 [Kribbella sp. VKM Ac-2568]